MKVETADRQLIWLEGSVEEMVHRKTRFVNPLRLFPFPRAKISPIQSTVPQPVPAACPSPEPWVDALKDDVETEFNLTLVDSKIYTTAINA